MVNRDYQYEVKAQPEPPTHPRAVVHAMFPEPNMAARALGALLDIGVQANDVSVMVKDLPPDLAAQVSGKGLLNQASDGITLTTPKDAAAGAVKGVGVGLGLGVLAALATIVVPGVGIVVGGGVLASALGATAAAGAAGAVAGAVVGYLKDQGVDDSLAYEVQGDFERGGALVSVSTPSGEASVEDIEAIMSKYKDYSYLVEAREIADARNPFRDPMVTSTQPYPRSVDQLERPKY